MMALDANEDGKLSLEEIKAAVKALKTLDENEDGELTLNEFGPAPRDCQAKPGFGLSCWVEKHYANWSVTKWSETKWTARPTTNGQAKWTAR